MSNIEMTAGTLYEANKSLFSQLNLKLNPMELATKQQLIEDWFNMNIDCYAMLYCHERRDITIFHLYENQNPNPPAVAAKELMLCLKERGDVASIDLNEDKAWEIWLKIDDEHYCYYLFGYDNAVVEC